MDSMSQVFMSILGLALFTWVAKYLFVLYYYRKKKEDINKLEARVAVLRMLLKAKLKRKGSQMQEQYKDEKEFFSTIASKLDLLCTYNFNRTSDYEDVIDILSAISEAIDFQTAKKNPAVYMAHQQKVIEDRAELVRGAGQQIDVKDESGASKTPEEIDAKIKAAANAQVPLHDRWSQLMKYDKGNMYIIKEIVETTSDLKIKIDLYNSEQDNKELRLRAPEVISVDGFEGLKALVDLDQQKSKANKEAKVARRQKTIENASIAATTPESSDSDDSNNAA